MSSRRALGALVVGLTAVGLGTTTASASLNGNFQAVHLTEWTQPGTAPLDGIGQWVYVAPIPLAQPGQVPTTGYDYGSTFLPDGGGEGVVALSSDDQGPIAGIQLVASDVVTSPPPVIIRYPWVPGQFYFLLAYHLPNDFWGGWVYDYSAGAWTFIGSVKAPAGWGLLGPMSASLVRGAQGLPEAPFWVGGYEAAPGTCGAFQNVDVYFSSPLGFRGTTATVGAMTDDHPLLGNCPTVSTVEYGGVIHRLGVPPTG